MTTQLNFLTIVTHEVINTSWVTIWVINKNVKYFLDSLATILLSLLLFIKQFYEAGNLYFIMLSSIFGKIECGLIQTTQKKKNKPHFSNVL